MGIEVDTGTNTGSDALIDTRTDTEGDALIDTESDTGLHADLESKQISLYSFLKPTSPL